MKSVTAAEFQGQCSQLIKEVMKTGVPVIIMENGQPVAQLGPVTSQVPTLAGAHKGQIRIVGDILEPLGEEKVASRWRRRFRSGDKICLLSASSKFQ